MSQSSDSIGIKVSNSSILKPLTLFLTKIGLSTSISLSLYIFYRVAVGLECYDCGKGKACPSGGKGTLKTCAPDEKTCEMFSVSEYMIPIL